MHIFSGETSWQDQLIELHLSLPDEPQPTFAIKVEKKRNHRKGGLKGLVLGLEGVENRDQSEALVGRLVYIPESFLVSKEGEEIYLREVLGFKVVDESRGEIGKVVGFSDNGAQDLLVVEDGEGNSFEVPFCEPILQKIYFCKQEIFMSIPQGLVFGEEL